MSNEVTGKLIHKGDIFVNPAGTFTKQEIVLELDNEYKNVAVLEGVQDMVQTLGDYNIGDEVKCTFYFNGRNQEWKGRYFNSLKIGSIERVGQSQPQQGYEAPQQIQPTVPDTPPFNTGMKLTDEPF